MAPALRSAAPNTTRATWAAQAAPAHIGHGSSVTTSDAPVSRQLAEAGGRVPQGQHLGVGGRVAEALPLVVAAGEEPPVCSHDHRADRHVTVGERGSGLVEGDAHRVIVVHGRQATGMASVDAVLWDFGGVLDRLGSRCTSTAR